MSTSIIVDKELEDLEMMPEWWYMLAICYLLCDFETGKYVGGVMVDYNITEALRRL